MNRLDDFELFHEKCKRRPLAEISKENNAKRPELKSNSRGIRELNMDLRADDRSKVLSKTPIRSNHSHGNSQSSFLLNKQAIRRNPHGFEEFEMGNYANKENLRPLRSGSYEPATGKSNNSSEVGGGNVKYPLTHESKINNTPSYEGKNGTVPIPLTHMKRLLKETRPLNPIKTQNSAVSLAALSANIRPGKLNEPSPRYKLLLSLVDYNPIVEKSNKVIRSFCDLMKLHESDQSSFDPTEMISFKLDTIQPDCSLDTSTVVTVDRITKVGPLLDTVTTSNEEEILLVNTNGTLVSVGSTIRLEESYLLDFGGTQVKVYFKWRIVV